MASILTPELIEHFVTARRRGGNDTDCAEVAGISPKTFWQWKWRYTTWRDTGNDPDPQAPSIDQISELIEADERAKAEARLLRLARIEAAGKAGTWQADAWWLERKFPDEFALRRNRLEVTGGISHTVTLELDDNYLAEFLNRFMARREAAGLEVIEVDELLPAPPDPDPA